MLNKKFDTNSLAVFLLFGVIHATMLIIVDHTNLIPASLAHLPWHLAEQVFTLFMALFLLCYNGQKSLMLLIRSMALTLVAAVPSIYYITIETSAHALMSNEYNVTLLTIMTLMCLFINYSYHKYNTFSLKYYEIYDAIYTPIAKLMLTIAYLLFILMCGIMIKALFTIIGSNSLQSLLENSVFRKCYISIAATAAMWLTYNKEYLAEQLFSVLSTACYYAYWVIAPLGLIFILAYLYSSFLFLQLTNISYDVILGISFISMLCNMRFHAEDAHWKEQPKTLKIITNIYNKVLPILPILLIYNIFFHFSIDTTFLDCQAHIMDTGIHWSNVSILVLITFLLLNNIAAAFYSDKDISAKNNGLPILAWHSFYAIILACYIIFVASANALQHSDEHITKCEKFTSVASKSQAMTNIRYLA